MAGEGLGRVLGDDPSKQADYWLGSARYDDTATVASLGDLIVDRILPLGQVPEDTYEVWEDGDWWPGPGESLEVEQVPDDVQRYAAETLPGGKATNQAAAAASAGAETAYLGRVGEDAPLDLLRERGVDLSATDTRDRPGGEAYIFLDEDGDNRIACTRPGGGLTTPDYARGVDDEMADADVVLLTNGERDDTLSYVLDTLEGENTTVVYDPSPIPGAERWLEHEAVDYATPNEHEYAALEDNLVASDATVIRTHADGADVDDRYSVEAPDIDPVDTTGAGDTFNGYLAAGLAAGMDEEAAVEDAVYAASLSVTREGAMPSVPERSEVDAFEAEHR